MSKRCKAISPLTGRRCTKNRTHNKTDMLITHENGGVVWGDRAGAKPTHVAVDETHRFSVPTLFDMESIGKDFMRTFSKTVERGSIFSMSTSAGMSTSAPEPLADWWRATAEQEIADTVPKAIEYGATDLIDIGVQLGKWMKRPLTDAEAAELGCWFYLIGKMARATSATDRGDMPSDDTVKDMGVYIKMIQRIRAAGSWPGEDLNTDGE